MGETNLGNIDLRLTASAFDLTMHITVWKYAEQLTFFQREEQIWELTITHSLHTSTGIVLVLLS